MGIKLKHGDKKHPFYSNGSFYCVIKNVMFQLEMHSSLKMKHKCDTEHIVTRPAALHFETISGIDKNMPSIYMDNDGNLRGFHQHIK